MAHIHIHLQEGFSGEEVRVAIDREERMSREAHTKRVLSLAFHEEFEVVDGPHSVQVAIPSRKIEKQIDVDAHGDVYIGLGLREDGLRVHVRDSPFGYG
jgi:hypothetical protein